MKNSLQITTIFYIYTKFVLSQLCYEVFPRKQRISPKDNLKGRKQDEIFELFTKNARNCILLKKTESRTFYKSLKKIKTRTFYQCKLPQNGSFSAKVIVPDLFSKSINKHVYKKQDSVVFHGQFNMVVAWKPVQDLTKHLARLHSQQSTYLKSEKKL